MGKKTKKRFKKSNNHKIEKFGRDALINKLLFIVIFSIISCVVLKFIYIGYIHVNYVLGMPKFMITLFVISLVITGLFGYRYFKGEQKHDGITYFIIPLACAISSISIYLYSLYAIRVLWYVIGIYMVVGCLYYIFKYVRYKKIIYNKSRNY